MEAYATSSKLEELNHVELLFWWLQVMTLFMAIVLKHGQLLNLSQAACNGWEG